MNKVRTKTENMFLCCETIRLSRRKTLKCQKCKEQMELSGIIESVVGDGSESDKDS